MTPDETTHLLSTSVGDSACLPAELGDFTIKAKKGTKFALWQIGAFGGILLAYADTSLVWATHETVASHFNDLQNSSWMMTSFTIGNCVTLPLYGRLSDTYGRLRPLIVAYCTFCIGTSLCGIGQAYWQVILGRIIAGCGASGLISLASIIITDIAAPSSVAVLRSYVNIASTVGLSLGGPLGGFLAETIGWRWSFLGQVPIAAACCVLLVRGLQNSLPTLEEADEEHLEETENEIKSNDLVFDFPGAISLAIGLSSFLAVIDLQNQLSWGHPLVIGITILAALSILAFLALEAYPGKREVLIPLPLLKTEVGAFCAGQLLIVGSCHGFVSQIAPYFSNTQGASDAKAGAQTIPSSVGNAVGALIAGQLIKRFGSYKKLSLASLILCIATALIILFQWSHPVNPWEALTTLPFGLFAGIVLSTQFIGLYLCAPKQYMATAISMYYMCQQIGIAVGIGLSSTLLQRQFQATLYKNLVEIPRYKLLIKSILSDSSIVAQLPMKIKSIVSQSYLDSFWIVSTYVISAQTLAILPMLFTTERQSE